MNLHGDRSVAVENRDIRPSEQLAAAYPELACLLRNDAVASAFRRFEETAVRWKRVYVLAGRTSLISIFLAMVIFDYQLTLKSDYGAPEFLGSLAAVFAAIGLISQSVLAFSNAKEKWLLARFGAERLRCFKFQLFLVLEDAPDGESLAAKVEERTGEGLAALEQELMGGTSAVLEFSPVGVVTAPKKKTAHAAKALIDDAAAVYDILRFSVQLQHFESQFREHDEHARLPSLLSEFSFGAGAVLACISILVTALPSILRHASMATPSVWVSWLDFLTWLLFVLSAVIAIHERGSAHQQNAERYLTFGREMRRIRAGSMSKMPASFFEAVREMEHLMLREIQDFCRDTKHSNYVF